MTEATAPAAPAPPPGPGVAVNDQQARGAIGAGLEVLCGADPARVLQLVDQLPLCKLVMRAIVSGELVLGRPTLPTPATPVNRAERRRDAAAARRTSGRGK